MDQRPFAAHTKSVEDLQWSPSEATVSVWCMFVFVCVCVCVCVCMRGREREREFGKRRMKRSIIDQTKV